MELLLSALLYEEKATKILMDLLCEFGVSKQEIIKRLFDVLNKKEN